MRTFGLLLLGMGMLACEPGAEAWVENDDATLDLNVERSAEVIQVALRHEKEKDRDDDDDAERNHGHQQHQCGCAPKTLTAVAEVRPPQIGGENLQASGITMSNSLAIVAYNLAGDAFGGGLQIVDTSHRGNPRLVSQALYPDADINVVAAGGSDLYVGLSENRFDDVDPAAIERIRLDRDGKFKSQAVRVSLQSYAVTGMYVSNSNQGSRPVFVTVGAERGGVYRLHGETLAIQAFAALEDARAVTAGANDTVVVLRGTPATVVVYRASDLTELRQFPLPGLTLPFAKATVDAFGEHAMVALGDGGFAFVHLQNGALSAQIPNPKLEGVDPFDVVTNAASADDELVFLANGGGGVRLGCVTPETSDLRTQSSASPQAHIIGTLRLAENDSANDVGYRSQVMVTPAGRGGVRLIEVR